MVTRVDIDRAVKQRTGVSDDQLKQHHSHFLNRACTPSSSLADDVVYRLLAAC